MIRILFDRHLDRQNDTGLSQCDVDAKRSEVGALRGQETGNSSAGGRLSQ